MIRRSRTPNLWCVLLLAALAGCGEPLPTDVRPRATAASAVELLECPTSVSASSSALVTPLGGTLSLGAHSVHIPAGALLQSALVTMTVPASRYMQVDFAVGDLLHYVFRKPVRVTIDYSRCAAGVEPGSAWYVADGSLEPLERMDAVIDRERRLVTFETDHFSAYALAD